MKMCGFKKQGHRSGGVKRLVYPLFALGLLILFAEMGWPKMVPPEDIVMDQVENVVKGYVASRLLQSPDTIDVRNMSPIPSQILARADRVSVLQGGSGDHRGLVGRSVFLIGVTSSSGDESQHWVNADVSVIRKVWMAARLIERGEMLTPDAFSMETLYQTRLEEQYVDAEADLVGQQASRAILPGEPLTPNRMKEAPVIKRGDRVTLLVEKDGIRITAVGRAKGEGFVGKMLAVVPMDSNKIIYGTVLDGATVQVLF